MGEETTTKPINPWDYKPWWCQPWSILLTGTLIILGSWVVLHNRWITILVSLPILTWMGFFLVLWPRLMVESGYLSEKNSDSH